MTNAYTQALKSPEHPQPPGGEEAAEAVLKEEERLDDGARFRARWDEIRRMPYIEARDAVRLMSVITSVFMEVLNAPMDVRVQMNVGFYLDAVYYSKGDDADQAQIASDLSLLFEVIEELPQFQKIITA